MKELHNSWVEAERRKADPTPQRRTLFEELDMRLEAMESLLVGAMRAPADTGNDSAMMGGYVKRYANAVTGEVIQPGHVINITRANQARLAVASDPDKFGMAVCTAILKSASGSHVVEYQCGGSLSVYVTGLTTTNRAVLVLATTRAGYLTDNPADYSVGKSFHQELGVFVEWEKGSVNSVSASLAKVDFTFSPPSSLAVPVGIT